MEKFGGSQTEALSIMKCFAKPNLKSGRNRKPRASTVQRCKVGSDCSANIPNAAQWKSRPFTANRANRRAARQGICGGCKVLVCTHSCPLGTNTIESVNRSLRKIIKNRSVFPSDDAASKLLYLALRNISQNWIMPIYDWKAALNRFSIQFEDRFPNR